MQGAIITLSIIIALLLATYFLVTVKRRETAYVDFSIGFILTLAYSFVAIFPNIDMNKQIFVCLATVTSLVGGLVGGVISLLLPTIASGIAFGVVVFLWIGTMLVGNNILSNSYGESTLLLILVCLSIALNFKFKDICFNIKICLIYGVLLVLSMDMLYSNWLYVYLGHVLYMDLPPPDACFHCGSSKLMYVWLVLSFGAFLIRSYLDGDISKLQLRLSSYGGYSTISQLGDDSEFSRNTGAQFEFHQKTFSYPDTLVYNYFDPDALPHHLQRNAEAIFLAAQSISAELGFQVDNSRNQAEHLLMLLANTTVPARAVDSTEDMLHTPMTPYQKLHYELFSNYRKWCNHLQIDPIFTPRKGTATAASDEENADLESKVDDMLIFQLIWGEAGNIRHMPECLCYLFHKTMAERSSLLYGASHQHAQPQLTAANNLYPGYYLDMVVTPIYDVIALSLKSKQDHCNKKIYDDFNEFFWTPNCLQFAHHPTTDSNLDERMSMEAGIKQGNNVSETELISIALKNATKTYVEKRSWLHALCSFRRLFEWHVLTFSILIIIALASQLVWTRSYTAHILSIVFWELNVMGIVWCALEVWTVYGTSSVTEASLCGYIFRFLAGYIVLVYQTVYYHWSFRTDAPESGSTRSQGDEMFWWWQYNWLSLLYFSLYIVDSFLCWVPSVESHILSSNNEFIQALTNICFPLSQIYVGKVLHRSQSEVFGYIAFWLVLIYVKLWFGYYYVVSPIAIPSIELFDDYMNFQNQSTFEVCVMMVAWWFPHFMVYIIDMSIWYSVLASIVGSFKALVDRQGAVREAVGMRSHFMKMAFAFKHQLTPSKDVAKGKISKHISQGSGLRLPVREKASLARQMSGGEASKSQKTNSSNALNTIKSGSAEYSKSTQLDYFSGDSKNMSNVLLSTDTSWFGFSKVWNAIIEKLREGDLISNSEKEILNFTYFDWLSRPVYLPLYQTAGKLEFAIYECKNAGEEFHQEKAAHAKLLIVDNLNKSLDAITWETVNETWELVISILDLLLGAAHGNDLSAIANQFVKWGTLGNLFIHTDTDILPSIADNISNVVSSLLGCVSKRRKTPVVNAETLKKYQESAKSSNNETNNSNMKKSVSTGFLSALANTCSGVDSSNKRLTLDSSATNKFKKLEPYRKSAELNDRVRDKIRDDLRLLFNNLKGALRKGGSKIALSIAGESQGVIDRLTFLLSLEKGFMWDDVYASSQIDEVAQDHRMEPMLKKLNGLIKLRQTQIEPESGEARRRLNFFVNSMFMKMPSVPPMMYSKDYTCMTPFYSEDVLLTKSDLESKNSSGVNTMLYLQTLYKKDWTNFLERRGLSDDLQIWSSKHIKETRMWASMRAQTLFRTVEGMMFTEAAIRLLSEIEGLSKDMANILAKLKFSYVVACQAYGTMKKSGDHKAEDIEFLLARYPNLRVAYIDTQRSYKEDTLSYYSVLIKHDEKESIEDNVSTKETCVKEVFRVKLPGNPILGEGKPENQNHAIIFTRGRYLQAIDMNQAGYFEEALKMRNLLEEFEMTNCKILGFREHIFTGSVSSVANYMALQELSFVTLGQRVLTKPLCIRQHYGHPDLFDKIFIMTEGGMSKASNGINLSEDVFAGFNCTIRGHKIGFEEYVQVGKGRDVGLQQTYKFEAKLSQGNAEQSLSRDMNRLCTRLDFFRLMSFYYGGIGHYMANAFVMFTLVLICYTMLCCALFNEEGIGGRKIEVQGVLQMLLAGMGILQTFPLMATLIVEKGVTEMISEISFMILSGGPLYFIFHIQTKSYYFHQTILAGGAMYRPTGRGFVIRHSPFDENFRFFATSHISLGFELMMALVLLGLYTQSTQYGGLTWSLWLAVVSFMFGPFWFNPLSFEKSNMLDDYSGWMRWMAESGGRAEQSWSTWWKEENAFIGKLSPSSKIMLFVQKCGMWLLVAVGLASRSGLEGKSLLHSPLEQRRVLEILLIVGFYFIGRWTLNRFEKSWGYAARRLSQYALSGIVIVTLLSLFYSHTAYFRYTVTLYYVSSAINFTLLLCGFKSIVSSFFRTHDYIMGHFLFVVLGLATLFQVGYLQTWLLYHNALSSGVVIEDVLKYARNTKERSVDEGDMNMIELKLQVAEQGKLLKQFMASNSSKDYLLIAPNDNANNSYSNNTGNNENHSLSPAFRLNSEGVDTNRVSESFPLYFQATSSLQQQTSLAPSLKSSVTKSVSTSFNQSKEISPVQSSLKNTPTQAAFKPTSSDFLFAQPDVPPPRDKIQSYQMEG